MRARNSYERKLMKQSGLIAAKALKAALGAIKPGTTGLEVDKIAEEEIYAWGGDLSYKTVPGYKFATCITVNEGVVHGIPTDRKFIEGDLVSVDLAVMYKGWHTDCAWSVLVRGKNDDEAKEKFLQVGEQALWDGIAQAAAGNKIGDISSAIQQEIESHGCNVMRSLVGHGVGRSLHEDPEVPGFGTKGRGPILKNAMTLAIEVIYAAGSSEVILGSDGWTYETADKSWGGLFEMTVLIREGEAEILTDWRKV